MKGKERGMGWRVLVAMVVVAVVGMARGGMGYYLPGVKPNDYLEGDKVPLTVNPLRSPHSVIPYDYYYKKFAFCQPEGGPVADRSNLGAVLFGDRIFNSPFVLEMQKNTSTCSVLCTKSLEPVNVNFLIERIQERYYLNWFPLYPYNHSIPFFFPCSSPLPSSL